MRSTVLVALGLVLSVGGGEGTPSSTQEAQATADRAGPAPPPDLQGFPLAPAPDELATVALPDNVRAVTALLERLPPEVAGHMRSPQLDRISPERARVGYGEDRRIAGPRNSLLWIQAMDVTTGDFFPTNWTGGQVVAFMARPGEEGTEAGRDGDLLWIRKDTFMRTAGSPARFEMMWGRVDSPWMFSIQADTRQNRDALLAAFITAAKSSRRGSGR